MSDIPYAHPDSDGRCRFCWLYFHTSAEAIDHEDVCRSKPTEEAGQ